MSKTSQIVKMYSDKQTLPYVAIKVNELTHSDTSNMADFEEVIRLDPVLTARLMKMVNSSFFGLAKKVESIPRAAAYVGMKALRNLVAVDSMKKIFKNGGETGRGFSQKNLWIHSATVAILAQMIAIRIFRLKGDDAFLAGILHDIGMIAEYQVEDRLFLKAVDLYQNSQDSFVACEQQIIGTDHCRTGALLAGGWNLSEGVLETIGRHHSDLGEQPITATCSIVQLAEYFAARLKFAPVPGRVASLPTKSLVDHVKDKMADYRLIVKDLPEQMNKAKDVYEID